ARSLSQLGAVGACLFTVAALYGLGVALDRGAWRALAWRMLGALAVTGLLVCIFKPLVARDEAWFKGPENVNEWLPRAWGRFPSGHAAGAFCVAGLLACASRRLRWPALLVAGVAAGARVIQGAHLPSDVFAGALLGLLVAGVTARRHAAALAREAPARPPSPAARSLALLVLLLVPLFFFRLGESGVWDPDEGRYAEIPREMLERGDLVTPTLDGAVYFEKPPLFYWLVAGAFRVIGHTEGAARLVPALAAVGGVLAAWWLGRRTFGERAGLLGAVILATSLLWAGLGHAVVIDAVFSTLLFLALALWWSGHVARGGRAWAAFGGAWVALGLAVLAKGPVALLLAGGTIGLFVVLARRWSALARRELWLTAPLLLVVAAPWFLLVSARHAGFDHFFWYQQHVGRFLGLEGSEQHSASPFYFVAWLPVLFFPWSPFALASLRDLRSLGPPTGPRQQAALFLLGGAFVVTLFFSLSDGKLLPYVEPALPLAAVPLGAWLDRQIARGPAALPRLRLAGAAVALLLLAGAVACVRLGPGALASVEARGPALAFGFALVLAACGAAVLVALARRQAVALVAVLAGGMVLLIDAGLVVGSVLSPNHTCKQLVQAIQPGLDAHATLLVADAWLPGLAFYSKQRLLVMGRRGELAFGLEQLPPAERDAWYADDSSGLADRLDVEQPVYCVVRDHETAQQLLPALAPGVQEIVWNRRRSILGNAAAAALTPPTGRLGSAPDP
ncbi:MAG TPA: phospholipid carrier-dependent glycosyltransferase, partial [Planctomycetota bacterium]|nr:phospholipid carrier-dependent glycosyltransferase [Planctomycetota bacterium]